MDFSPTELAEWGRRVLPGTQPAALRLMQESLRSRVERAQLANRLGRKE